MGDFTKQGPFTNDSLPAINAARLNAWDDAILDAVTHHKYGPLASRPAAAPANKNWLYIATDGPVAVSDGAAWHEAPAGGGGTATYACAYERSSSLSLAANVYTYIPFDVLIYDPQALRHATNQSQFFAPVDGVYLVSLRTNISPPTQLHEVAVRKNGLTFMGFETHPSAPYGERTSTIPVFLLAGDYVELAVYTPDLASYEVADDYSIHMTMARLG